MLKKEAEENVMLDALLHLSEARRMWLIKMFSLKHSEWQHFPYNTLSVTTYPSHFKLSASHHDNLQRERELLWRYFRMWIILLEHKAYRTGWTCFLKEVECVWNDHMLT